MTSIDITQDVNQTQWTYNGSPALVAHRGFARLYPENTLPAIAAAVDAGARYVEFDIQLSKDHVPFLMHDADFLRTAGLDQKVFDLTMNEIKQISVGEQARLGGRFHDVKPISLEQACEHLNDWPNVHSFIEIKQQSIDAFGLETTMSNILAAIKSLESPHTLISFSIEALDYLNNLHATQDEIERRYTTGWVFEGWSAENFATLKRLSPEFVYSNYKKIPANADLPQGNWSWVLYDITEPEIAQHWRRQGIHMIETMHVTSMLNSKVFSANSDSTGLDSMSIGDTP